MDEYDIDLVGTVAQNAERRSELHATALRLYAEAEEFVSQTKWNVVKAVLAVGSGMGITGVLAKLSEVYLSADTPTQNSIGVVMAILVPTISGIGSGAAYVHHAVDTAKRHDKHIAAAQNNERMANQLEEYNDPWIDAIVGRILEEAGDS